MGNTTKYEYDSNARITSKTYADGRAQHFAYNKNSTLKTLTHEDGHETHYKYDKANRVTSIINADEISYYHYDTMGNLLSASDENSVVEYSYNSHAQVTTHIQNGIDVDKRWDKDNQALLNLSFLEQSFSYTRDESGSIKSIKTALSNIELNYDDNGILQERLYPNKQAEILSYDSSYNVTKIQTAKEELTYTYDELGQVQSKNDKAYSYDKTGRLTQSPQESFSYDKAGNNLNNQARYNPYNYQLVENETHTFSYDARANLSIKRNKQTQESIHYTYNLKNQLIKVLTKDHTDTIIEELCFTYDALNRRVSKTTNQTTRYYLYDGSNIIAILDEHKTLLASIIHSDEIDTPLSITTYDNEPKELTPVQESYFQELSETDQTYLLQQNRQRTYYYHRDHQGSIIALTDKDANIVESFIYDESYGKILEHYKEVQTHNPYAYTARELDQKDLYYYRARYYDPQTERFLSQDSIQYLSGDFNWYRYVENSPTNYTDPFGFKKKGCQKYTKLLDKYKKQTINKIEKKVTKLGLKSAAKGVLAAVTVEIPFIDVLTIGMAADGVNDLRLVEEELSQAMENYNILESMEKECKEREKKRASAQKSGKDGAKVKGKKLKKKKVKCFKKKQDKHDAQEYDKQLKNQQDGLNAMSADDYIKGREAFDGIACKDGKATTNSSLKNRPKRNANEAKKARKKYEEKILIPKYRNTNPPNPNPAAAAAKEMKTLAALHNPDMVAAGKDMITGFGDKGVNSSIGSQWGNGTNDDGLSRVAELDNEACKAKKDGKGKEKMNAELKRCKKK